MTDLTTIKVPKTLRDAVMRSARAEGLTAAEFLQLHSEHASHLSSRSSTGKSDRPFIRLVSG